MGLGGDDAVRRASRHPAIVVNCAPAAGGAG
jgi:hypothetical protein